ncbi:MAG: hypothetical protein JWM33_3086 [Caulobacteraceae bacterium]|nr:hypothetical protein [Caulobacteraceae bacterium]
MRLALKEGAETRTLKIGDVYGDGWKLTALTPSMATFGKGSSLHSVGLNPQGLVLNPEGDAKTTVDVVGGDARAVIAAYIELFNCFNDYNNKVGRPLGAEITPADLARASSVLGAERYKQCAAASAASNLSTPALRRAVAEAVGDVNSVRRLDGLEPIGPARVPSTSKPLNGFDDSRYIPGTVTVAGYISGTKFADGSYYYYRTPADRQAAADAGVEYKPVATPEYLAKSPAERSADYQAWLRQHPDLSAR